jgi:hypothetical protein
MKTPKCGVGFVLIFERYLIATAYRPYAVDPPQNLAPQRLGAFARTCAENGPLSCWPFARRCGLAAVLGRLASHHSTPRCIAFAIGLLRRRPIFWLGTDTAHMAQRSPDP